MLFKPFPQSGNNRRGEQAGCGEEQNVVHDYRGRENIAHGLAAYSEEVAEVFKQILFKIEYREAKHRDEYGVDVGDNE